MALIDFTNPQGATHTIALGRAMRNVALMLTAPLVRKLEEPVPSLPAHEANYLADIWMEVRC